MNELWRVDQGDCLEWLAAQPEQSVDLVLTSPPYELARHYLEKGKNLGIARKTEAWVAWQVECIKASLRVCKGLVAFVVEGQTKQFKWSAGPALLMADLHRAGVCLRKPPAFHRIGIPGSGGPDWWRNDYEFIVCCTNGGKLPWSDNTATGHAPKWQPGGAMSNRQVNGNRLGRGMANGIAGTTKGSCIGRRVSRGKTVDGELQTEDAYLPPDKANPGNVLWCKVGGGLMGHPLAHENEAPFPTSLTDRFVLCFCPPGGVVADPFMGSGTVGHSAIAHGRRFTGCDLRQSQVDLARRRLDSVTPSLFS